MKILILLLSLSTFNSLVIYNASEFIEMIRNETKANETILKGAIENTKEFLKHYIYYIVASDPPQPDFNNSYFPKLDIDNLFDNIKINDTNYFDFRTEFFLAVYKLNDLHTVPFLQRIPIQNFAYICPIELTTRYDKETGSAKMYGNFGFQTEYYFYFKNYEQVVQVIQKNLNTPIESINGKDPFSFIQEFTDIKLRSQHATYVFKQAIYTKNNLNIPVSTEELTNFKVVYSNGDNFTTDYLIQDVTKSSNNFKYYENEEDNEKFLSYLSEHNKKFNSYLSEKPNSLFSSLPFINNLDDIILEYEEKNKVKSNNIFLSPNKIKNKANEIEWKYTYISIDNKIAVFQCRIDEINHVNVMRINNFGGTSDSEASLEVAEKCAYLFDENDYRIVIIFPRNGGGNPIIGYNIIELLSPYILTRNSLRIKKDKNMDIFIELYNSFNLFIEMNSTNKINGSYFNDSFISEIYGDKTEEFSKPFAWKVNQAKIEEIKKKLKHKRIPTEILIMTDGFAYSAASSFMKNAYKSGAGIIIGYNGNPNLPDDTFDISQSPSAVLSVGGYKDIYPEIYEKTVEYLIGLQGITCIATYHEFQESHIPQEYDVQIADKRVKIFNSYDDIYYQEFIDEAIKVLDTYQENCNPNNKNLVLFSDECIFNEHLNGGYGCGSDSKWNKTNCVPVYCDEGYYYNKISNSCIVYPIEKDEEEEEEKEYEEENEKEDENEKEEKKDENEGEEEKDENEGEEEKEPEDEEEEKKDENEGEEEKEPEDEEEEKNDENEGEEGKEPEEEGTGGNGSGEKNDDVWLIVGISVGAFIILLAIVLFILYKKHLLCPQKDEKIDDLGNKMETELVPENN